MRRVRTFAVIAVLSLVGVVAGGAVSAADRGGVGPGQGGIEVVPVHGQEVGHGLRLFVDVFYAKDDNPGRDGRPSGGGTVDCTDTNDQSGSSAPFAYATALTLHLNTATVPTGLNASGALGASAAAWNGAGAALTVLNDGSETTPSNNAMSTIGWVRIVPKNVLAATWSWVDGTGHITEADVFFNTSYSWNVFAECTGTSTGKFDVGDIATHEIGHVLGLSHYSDSGKQGTMYPSAPADEIRKRTLTAGDIAALGVSLDG